MQEVVEVKKPQAKVDYEALELPRDGATRHRWTMLTIEKIPEDNPVIELDLGSIGVRRLIVLEVSPIGEVFGVAWNGDADHPALRFDNYPPQNAKVLLHAWGR